MFRVLAVLVLLVVAGCRQNASDTTTNGHRYLATVASYTSSAEWDQFEDGSFAAYDALSLKCDGIGTIEVSVPAESLSDDSPFRKQGTRFSFQLDKPLDEATRLSWGSIKQPLVIEE